MGMNRGGRREVVVAKRYPHVGVIQKVKKLATNLQAKSLREFCSLIDAEVDGISAGAIEVATRQHVLRKWTKVGDAGDRVDIRAVKPGAEVKVVKGVRSAAGIRYGRSRFRMGRCLDCAHASCQGICAIVKGKWEAATNRNDGGRGPSVQESLRRASHVSSERNVPGTREHETVTLIEVGIAFVNFRVERIQESEIRVVTGLAKG